MTPARKQRPKIAANERVRVPVETADDVVKTKPKKRAAVLPDLNLLANHHSLFGSQETGTGFAVHRAGQTDVGAMPSFGIIGAGATRFVASDSAFRDATPAHGFGYYQFSSEVAEVSGGRCRIHAFILRLYMP